ncbi:ABC transporter permease [Actinoplanes palleronii]|uniref:ABC transporter permease n=1 Tax=Actinoplanes palleronii TaxID=113570 RepID=UPI0019424213|nr:ABC transporter permease [Actinoplanes palleronii]
MTAIDLTRGRFAWLSDLALAVRLSVAGGRSGWLRLTMIAAGVGLGVAMLLLVAAVPTAGAAREQRRNDRATGAAAEQAGPGTLLVLTVETRFRDVTVRGRMVRAEGARAPVPPGLSRVPAAGELVVSPALAALLDGPGGELLAERWPARVTGTIAATGLSGPDEVYFYLGSGTLRPDGGATRVTSFGGGAPSAADPTMVTLAIIGLVIVLLPVLIFVMTAVRFGSETRERQLAAIRLVGADSRMTHRIAAGDSLVGAVLGLAVGALGFLAARPFVGGLLPADFTPYPKDLEPGLTLVASIVILVPVGAVLVTVSALRRVIIEPLGVVRRGIVRRRRLWWRLLPPAAGVALLAGGQLAAGVLLLLVGVVSLLPWLVQAVVRRLGGGSVAWQLGVRRLQLDSDTAVRAVSGIAVSVAGVIAIQGLLGASVAATSEAEPPKDRFQAAVFTNGADGTGWATELSATAGVREVRMSGYGQLGDYLVRLGDCDVLRQFAPLPSCADGDSFVATMPGWESGSLPAGETVPFTGADRPLGSWTAPAGRPTVRLYTSAAGPMEYLATPGALGIRPDLRGTTTDAFLITLDPGDPDAIERLRTTMTRVAPDAPLQVYGDEHLTRQFQGAQQVAQSCAVLLLLFIGASMLVNVVEQLRERRRLLAVLTAFGATRRVLSASVFYQVAIPAAIGIALAVVTGGGLSATLLSATGAPVDLDWPAITGITTAGITMVLAVTAASLPLLARLTKAQELRSE